jgi:biopolymer transport protein ExbB/TolQ
MTHILTIAEPLSAVTPDQATTWLDLLMKGGIIMIPIVLLSFISVYIFIERYSYIKKATSIETGLVNSVAYSAYHFLQLKIDRYTINLQENLINFLKVL